MKKQLFFFFFFNYIVNLNTHIASLADIRCHFPIYSTDLLRESLFHLIQYLCFLCLLLGF